MRMLLSVLFFCSLNSWLSLFPFQAAGPASLPAVARGPRPGQVKLNLTDGQPYVWIPPGRFLMGCSPEDKQCNDNERPAHNVTLSQGFWLGQTVVTVGAWKRYRRATGKPALPTTDALGRNNLNEASGDDAMPAVSATWDEAQSFCQWGAGNLPTEAQWEYAARAGDPGSRPQNLDSIAWYADNSGKQQIDSTQISRTDHVNYARRLFENGNGPHRVAHKKPNGWNLYDMLGNVWEWTADWYEPNGYGQQDSQNPSGPTDGKERVQRGGSWLVSPRNVRVSSRGWAEPANRDPDDGFRCVKN